MGCHELIMGYTEVIRGHIFIIKDNHEVIMRYTLYVPNGVK